MNASEIDVRAARRRFERAAATYGEVAVLAREVERRMAERLTYIRYRPQNVLDAGCGPGDGLRLLRRHYPKAGLIGLDSASAMTRAARRAQTITTLARDFLSGAACSHVCSDLARMPFAAGSVGMVWSNLALAWTADPLAALTEIGRVLEPQGLLMFSTYGPDTLRELREAFARVDRHPHVHRFGDMHDFGDLLVAAGLADPVMDMEMVTLAYADVGALARDLRLSGQSNVATGRGRGLLTPRAWACMADAYEVLRRDGRLPATFEIVYGHAWKGESRARPDGSHVVNVQLPRKKAK